MSLTTYKYYVNHVTTRRLKRRRTLTQSEDDANALHDFNDIENEELRAYNRGAVLANIHEKYCEETGGVASILMQHYINDMTSYIQRIPLNEVQSAKESMRVHLNKRGLDG